MTDPIETMNAILDDPLDAVVERERTEFDRLAAGYPKLVLHGAGRLGRKTLAGLRSEGIEPVAFTDNNSASWGTSVDGLAVTSPQRAAAEWGSTASFVVCTWSPGADRVHAAIERALMAQGARNVVSFIPLFWKYPDRFLPHYRVDLPSKLVRCAPQLREVFDLFEDDRSRAEFARQVCWLAAPRLEPMPAESTVPETYFPASVFQPSAEECLIDCGAFDGDTLKAFLAVTGGRFEHVYCFEPDPINFEALKSYVASLDAATAAKITIAAAAVGSVETTLRMEPTGTVSSVIVDSGSVEIPCVRLDDTIDRPPTYIKTDIEGFEPLALEGAEMLIRRHRPRLAVCVYHLQDHLWTLPLQMRSYGPDYRFYLRRHGDQFGDIVAYALPPNS